MKRNTSCWLLGLALVGSLAACSRSDTSTPRERSGSVSQQARTHYLMARGLLAVRAGDRAVEAAQEAIRLAREWMEAHILYIDTRKLERAQDETLPEYEAHLQSHPEDAGAHYPLARAQRQVGKLAGGNLDLRVAVRRSVEPRMSVGRNIQISQVFPSDLHYEFRINADPSDPSRLMACSMVYPRDAEGQETLAGVVYNSFDGGTSWMPTLHPPKLIAAGDPGCGFGPNGNAYYVALATRETDRGTWIYRSPDGGRTWEEPVLLTRQIGHVNFVVADYTSKYRGSVYITAGLGVPSYKSSHPVEGPNARPGLVVWHSRDGAHFSATPRVAPVNRHPLWKGNSAVLSDGTLIFVFGEVLHYVSGLVPQPAEGQPNGVLQSIRSTDGGGTLEDAVKVADYYQKWPGFSTLSLPYVAVDLSDGPFKDRAYVTWSDQRSGRAEVYVAFSDDRGMTWTNPILVSDDRIAGPGAAGADNFMPVIGVNKAGVVGVSWQDRRDNPDNLGYWLRFSASLDGGETWLPSVRVSEKPNTVGQREEWPITAGASSGKGMLSLNAGYSPFAFSGGDYAGLAVSADGVFHPTWIDNRTGIAQIWTAPVQVDGRAVRHGSPELSAMQDISDVVALELTRPMYDRATSTLSMRAVLRNTSRDPIYGPIKVRVVSIDSEIATVKIAHADNGLWGPGAIWDLSSLLTDGVLAPGSRSDARRLAFTLSDLRPFRQGDEFKLGLVSVDARLLAGSADNAGQEGK